MDEGLVPLFHAVWDELQQATWALLCGTPEEARRRLSDALRSATDAGERDPAQIRAFALAEMTCVLSA